MISAGKHVFGCPISTGAVIADVPGMKDIPYLSVIENNSLLYRMDSDTAVYGLGPHVRGLNKRGWIYESFNTDESLHSEDKRRLYGSHNYLLIDAPEPFGVFIDTPGFVTWDIGYSISDELRITVRDGNYTLYLFEADSLEGLAESLRKLTGPSYVPPLWAFGFNQSRWGYQSAADVEHIIEGYRKADMPFDMITLDIDYMDHYKDFTVDSERFPDFPAFVQKLGQDHIHLVPIIDAGVKAEPGYAVYDECMERGYYCRKADGNPFFLGVWPGRCVFPDFLNPDAAAWFGRQYHTLTDMGIRGFWKRASSGRVTRSISSFRPAILETSSPPTTDQSSACPSVS